ncbi:sugar O-acetyltransferase [bacterium]|nr:sugar O-acetyltransferase [bacterium]
MNTSQREKMLNGELYLASDPELKELRNRARFLWQRFNLTSPDEEDERQQILQELLGKFGSEVWIEPPFYCDYGKQIELADGVYINMNCIFLDPTFIRIGSQTLIGPNVQLYTAFHPIDAATRVSGPELASPISIGKRVWIGGGAIILPGVNIGDNTTIGAGSVVTHDIPEGVVAAGNPCRIIRSL